MSEYSGVTNWELLIEAYEKEIKESKRLKTLAKKKKRSKNVSNNNI